MKPSQCLRVIPLFLFSLFTACQSGLDNSGSKALNNKGAGTCSVANTTTSTSPIAVPVDQAGNPISNSQLTSFQITTSVALTYTSVASSSDFVTASSTQNSDGSWTITGNFSQPGHQLLEFSMTNSNDSDAAVTCSLGVDVQAQLPALTLLYRLYNPTIIDFMISKDPSEASSTYTYYGEAFTVYQQATTLCGVELYRCREDLSAASYHFTSTDSACGGYVSEGSYGYICPASTGGANTPLTRITKSGSLSNGSTYAASLTTASPSEVTTNVAQGWADAGIQGYAPYTAGTSTIQGLKLAQDGSHFISPGATISISDGTTYGPSTDPYIDGSIAPSTYTVQTSIPTGYTPYYSLCVNCTNHGPNSYVQGSSATVQAPGNGFIDLYWLYLPTPN